MLARISSVGQDESYAGGFLQIWVLGMGKSKGLAEGILGKLKIVWFKGQCR
jgi:hypothetical protein